MAATEKPVNYQELGRRMNAAGIRPLDIMLAADVSDAYARSLLKGQFGNNPLVSTHRAFVNLAQKHGVEIPYFDDPESVAS